MIIAGSIEISSHGGIFGDNHLEEIDGTFVNLQRNIKKNEEVSFVYSFCLPFSLIFCFSFCILFCNFVYFIYSVFHLQ